MGDEQIEQHAPHVYRFVVYTLGDHHTAMDIAQETILRGWKRRREFRELHNPRAWLLRIAANLCRDHVRARKNRVRNATALADEPASTAPEPWFAMLQDEECHHLDEVIGSLSGRERTVLYLKAFEGLSHQQIAEVLEISVGAVKVALSRARKSVRKAIEDRERQRQTK